MGKRSSILLIDEQPLQVIPTLAAAVGVNEAILLQQINYWCRNAEKSKDARKFIKGRWWTFNSYQEWQEQMPWMSVSGIRKLVKKLREKKLIWTVKHKKHEQDHRLWYTINYEAVDALMGADQDQVRSDPECHTDVTQSDTSERPGVTDHDVTQSDTPYIESENPESQSENSRRDGKPPPEGEKPINYFDVFAEAATALGYEVTAEDRKELPGNLKKLRDSGEHDDGFMRKVVRRCLVARADRQYPLSPQRARDELLGNVTPLRNGSANRHVSDHALKDAYDEAGY